MTTALTLQLVETVTPLALGTPIHLDASTAAEIELIRRWCEGTGNTVIAVHPDQVEVMRGRVADPIAALAPDRRPGYRLWVYTNFNCNLACDYCCVASSPRADPRSVGFDDFCRLVDDATHCGVAELYLTGGEPMLLADLPQRLQFATARLRTTVLTNGMLLRGGRLERLKAVSRKDLTLQISLDSATPDLHERHRGAGSFSRTIEGIETARSLGFRVRLAATLGADADDAEQALEALFDRLELEPDQRVVRRVAHQGSANAGLTLSRRSLMPEVCVTADGVWWHPVAAIDPEMRVSESWQPLDAAIEAIRDEYRDHRMRGEVLASSFPCA
jgi:pyruvate-formate lyase-activating enzyme